MLGMGLYNFPEAARYTRLNRSKVREWFVGRPTDASREPVFFGDYPPIGHDRALSFHDLVDLYVAGRLREFGLSLQRLRRVHTKMKRELDTPHPFCKREILTDGLNVFTRIAHEQGFDELIDVLKNQRVFPTILMPFLKKIVYDPVTDLARQWAIADMVIMDRAMCFGKPIVESVSIPTIVLAKSYCANQQNADLVADWYGIQPDHVRAAVNFERQYAA
jgi:uncharacterized protein (DUF433 family)